MVTPGGRFFDLLLLSYYFVVIYTTLLANSNAYSQYRLKQRLVFSFAFVQRCAKKRVLLNRYIVPKANVWMKCSSVEGVCERHLY